MFRRWCVVISGARDDGCSAGASAADENAANQGLLATGPRCRYRLNRAARALLQLPLSVLYAVFGALAWLARAAGWRMHFVTDGLVRCLPDAAESERRRIATDFYRFLGELAAEAVHGARIGPQDLADRLRFENPEAIEDVLRSGRRAMLLAAHHCNWEWLLLRCSTAFGAPLVAAYKPASRERADRALATLRSRLGATMVG